MPVRTEILHAQKPARPWRAGHLLVLLACTLSLLAVALGNVSSTVAFFQDTETATGNVLQAGALAFTVSGPLEITLGDSTMFMNVQPEFHLLPGSLPATFTVAASSTLNENICNNIYASTATPFNYMGTIDALAGNATTTDGVWPIEVSITNINNFAEESTCGLDLIITASTDPTGTGGFTDSRTIPLTIHVVPPPPAPPEPSPEPEVPPEVPTDPVP